MSSIYEAKLRTKIKETTPLLYQFLNMAINTKEEPTADFYQHFMMQEIAELAFYFVRYSRAPEFFWSSPYSEYDRDSIADSWVQHSKYNEADAEVLGKTDVGLFDRIENYPNTSFSDGLLFFTNEYSSNDSFNFEMLVEFINANRDSTNRLVTAFMNENQAMPTVTLYINNRKIELFEGAYMASGSSEHTIQYDRNGFFCGSYIGHSGNDSITNIYDHRPPYKLKYKIDWLNEADIHTSKLIEIIRARSRSHPLTKRKHILGNLIMKNTTNLNKPDEGGLSILSGTLFILVCLILSLTNETPTWFLVLLSSSGTFLIIYPLFVRHFIVRTLIHEGGDPAKVKNRWKINIGFARI